LKLTLHLFWLLYRKSGTPRCASDRELLADPLLRRALRRRGDPRPVDERLRAALELALMRRTLLRVRVQVDDDIVTWLFLKAARRRHAGALLVRGEGSPELVLEAEGPGGIGLSEYVEYQLRVEIERLNIYALYEQNIGLLLPLLAEELRE